MEALIVLILTALQLLDPKPNPEPPRYGPWRLLKPRE